MKICQFFANAFFEAEQKKDFDIIGKFRRYKTKNSYWGQDEMVPRTSVERQTRRRHWATKELRQLNEKGAKAMKAISAWCNIGPGW